MPTDTSIIALSINDPEPEPAQPQPDTDETEAGKIEALEAVSALPAGRPQHSPIVPTGPPLPPGERLITPRYVCQDLSIRRKTLDRWLKRDPSFPRPISYNGRNYFITGPYQAWKRNLILRAARRAEV